MNKSILLALLALGLVVATGCKASYPVLEPTAAITLPNASINAVHDRIVSVIKSTRWSIINDEPGALTIRLSRGNGPRSVTAKIAYTATNYTITLVDAVEMDYDPEAKTISRKYNQWIRNLDLRISRAL